MKVNVNLEKPLELKANITYAMVVDKKKELLIVKEIVGWKKDEPIYGKTWTRTIQIRVCHRGKILKKGDSCYFDESFPYEDLCQCSREMATKENMKRLLDVQQKEKSKS
jgi:hypothetical protein